MNANTNLNWQYYRNYFHGQDLSDREVIEKGKSKKVLETEATEQRYKTKNKDLTESAYTIDTLPLYYANNQENNIELYTTYPGLLIGSGYQHEVSAKGELKLGFFFDYTTGLPIIPGSSVKGLLRSAFPQWEKDKKTPDRKKWVKTLWIESLLTGKSMEELDALSSDEKERTKQKITKLELAIFEGIKDNSKIKPEEKFYSIYERDIFLDAIIVKAGKNDWILGIDSITPHIKDNMTYEQAMLKNPVPIPFLKILPNVKWKFHFDLKGNLLTKSQKRELFKQILLTLGIGAKTNVGYGQFSETPMQEELSSGKAKIIKKIRI